MLRCLAVLFLLLVCGVANAQAPKTIVSPAPRPSPLPSAPTIIIQNIPPAPSPSPWWKDFPWTFCAAFVAGGGVLGAALIARNTSERKRLSDERIAEERQKQEKELAEKRQEQERLHFARKEQQDQFVDIQNRFKEADITIRANAALRLADFAERLLPRTAEQEAKEPNPPHTASNYPYFVTVAAQLTTALYLEKDAAARGAIVQALATLTTFAANADGQPLLYTLIEQLANANRLAKETFITALAQWAATNKEWKEYANLCGKRSGGSVMPNKDDKQRGVLEQHCYSLLTAVAPFCTETENTKTCLESLMLEGGSETRKSKFLVQQAVYQAKYSVLEPVEQTKADAERLPRIEEAAAQLIATRAALATALRALPTAENLPLAYAAAKAELDQAVKLVKEARTRQAPYDSTALEVSATSLQVILQTWVRTPTVTLPECFLAGSNLIDANLQGVGFYQTHLQGAFLMNAQLQGAFLCGIQAQGADLGEAQLQGAHLDYANLQGANFIWAQLQGAGLMHAKLQTAKLEGAWLQKTCCIQAQLQQADLTKAGLEGANLTEARLERATLTKARLSPETILYGVFIQEATSDNVGHKRTEFSGTNWWSADFTSNRVHFPCEESSGRTNQVKDWLETEFPTFSSH